MLRRIFAVLLLLSPAAVAPAAVAAARTCAGSAPVTTFRLSASPAGNTPAWVPFFHINNLPAGTRIRYQPGDLPADLRKDAKLTLVLVPKASDGSITVLEPRLAAASTEWQMPFLARIVVLVFAPQGLDEKRLTNLVTKDDVMATALADYADQTADLEASMNAIGDLQDFDDTARPRPTTPAEQALFALVRALNPAVSSYDPLSAGRRAGPTTMMGKGAETFFDNAGGLFLGSGVLPEVRPWLMPDTEFRSVYVAPKEEGDMALCAKVQPKAVKNAKIAYLWAYRVINAPAPAMNPSVPVTHLPIGMRAGVPLKLTQAADWRLLSRVFDWTLAAEGGSAKAIPVEARVVEDERALQLDLRKFSGAPGTYRLEGRWDWGPVKVNGLVWLHRMDDLTAVHLTPESQDRLVAGAGPVTVDVTGADLTFIDHAFLHRPTSSRQIPVDLPPVGLAGPRTDPAAPLPADVDTDGLRPGPYLLTVSRIDGATADVPVQLLPPVPRIDTQGARVNLGDREEAVTLTGTGLNRIQSLEGDRADVALQPGGEDGVKRTATVRLHADVKAGDRVALAARVAGMTQPVRFPGVLQVTAARPHIAEAKAALAREFEVGPLKAGLKDGELPSGSFASFSIRADYGDGQPILTVQCSDPAVTVKPLTIRAGERLGPAQLSATAPGVLFLSLDPGAVGASGCALTATVETEALGKSDPFPLGTVVRLPRVESFALSDEKSVDGFVGIVKGFDLDTIDKTGWDGHSGLSVTEAPRPVAGEGARQTLRISMPWPSPTPKAPLYIFLRGESDGRATGVAQ